ncbi:hypothetical protein NUU61_006929 [Penicillium alfredii]|uniref:Uncharacterized protein n=1 Tax=Penicillium alfredii TaxID=1506179 RepID=A0A9W9F1W0_9EURO|nr:uncharacterized protein NUU61_006929 [Penicillium alfredii]KAJ5092059.1 hypothetical protein NUU61_006929 [Penicillium alfredii]
MYGSNQPGQPEWRLPPRPPRQPVSQLPPPPPNPPPASSATYTPATYGPISTPSASPGVSPVTGAGVDTRTWGVRYNQHQSQTPPPVPPRPAGANEPPFAHAQSQSQSQSPVANFPSAPFHGFQSASELDPPYISTAPPPPYTRHPAESVPPPPPKIPEHPQNDAQPGSQAARPPLLSQGSAPAALAALYGFPPSAAGRIGGAPTSSSALGPGTPSDWEHLGPTPGDIDDENVFSPHRSPSPIPEAAQTPPGYSTGVPNTSLSAESSAPPTRDRTNTAHSIVSRADTWERGDPTSPVSPATTQGRQSPAPPIRVNTTDSDHSMDSHSESIDNVIDAWVRPLSPPNKRANSNPEASASLTESLSPVNQNSPKESSESAQTNVITAGHARVESNAIASPTDRQGSVTLPKNEDPYADLEPWFKSSLTRYVAMLRKEAVADSDEERYKIFTAFTAKETKLREILYNIEHEPQETRTIAQAPLPSPQHSSPKPAEPKSPAESGLIPVESEIASSTEDLDDTDDLGSEYSSGGRPVQAKRARRASSSLPKLFPLSSEAGPAPRPPRTSSLRLSMDPIHKQTREPLATNPPRPIYTPFQYTEGPQRGSDDLTFDRPAYQAYSDLRQASAVSGRVMANAPTSAPRSRSNTATSLAPSERDETFMGVIRRRSLAYVNTDRRNNPLPALPPLPESLRQNRPNNPVEGLRTLVWTPMDQKPEGSWHITTREGFEKFHDDFSYIQTTIDNWEAAAHPRRQKLEEDRTVRQEESEAQIDNLFNEKEIGYADINTLEEEFRQTEARAQLGEERQEVEDFITQVFNPLDERLKTEISALRKSYDAALGQLDREQKGKKSSLTEQCSPSRTMKMVNEIHSKLEIRFQKRLEIALDCERRRKKAERRPLVFMGDMASLRKLDGDFDQMEKRNILEAAKDRDDRANRLMDSFDDAILHGLGMNQSLLDELGSKVARLDPTALHTCGLPDSEIEQILKSAATFAASLRADSEAILRSSGVADMALNDADYSVSAAEAQYADSESDVLPRLEAEKTKEDSKIQTELASKLDSIQKGPMEVEETIQRLLKSLKEAPPAAARPPPTETPAPAPALAPARAPASLPASVSPGPRPQTTPAPAPVENKSSEEDEHQERLRKALEDAKKRNAARNKS